MYTTCLLLLPVRFFCPDWGEVTTALGPNENDLNSEEGGRKRRRIQMKKAGDERRDAHREKDG